MKLVFMGSPDFSVPSLEGLIESGHEVKAVYTQPPRPAGRGKILQKQPVHLTAEKYGLAVRTPIKLRDNEEEFNYLKSLHPDVIIVAAYGLLLPEEILNLPEKGCLNIHASLLPRWRGASPIQSALRAGDRKTGICIMQMDKGLDTGAVILRCETDITGSDTAETLHDRLALLGRETLLQALEKKPVPIPQSDVGVCYAPRLKREDGKIDWTRSAKEIDCQIRAFTPWPGNFTTLDGQVIRIGAVSLISENDIAELPPGTLLDDRLTIACGKGILRLDLLQKPGRSMMEAAAFLRGHAVAKGTYFV